MKAKLITSDQKTKYESAATHPLHSWAWGEFQESQGHKIYRIGLFNDQDKIAKAFTVSYHRIPKTKFSVGTCLRGPSLDQDSLDFVYKISQKENAIFVKLEPDVIAKEYDKNNNITDHNINIDFKNLVVSPKDAFYPHSYVVDLTKSEEELLAGMHPKTRYNIKVANRYNVEIKELDTQAAFDKYLDLTFDTTARQGFYLHSRKYHQTQWNILKKTGMTHLMQAIYNGQVLSAFMIFKYKDRLFYPYGASLNINREVMAPTLLMWEVIKLGKKLGCTSFDMWGSLGPNAREGQNGYGFHRFKQGYGGTLVEFVGTYDLVINSNLYKLYNIVDKIRWKILRLKASVLKK